MKTERVYYLQARECIRHARGHTRKPLVETQGERLATWESALIEVEGGGLGFPWIALY